MPDLELGIDARGAESGADKYVKSAERVTRANNQLRDSQGRFIKGARSSTTAANGLSLSLGRLVGFYSAMRVAKNAVQVIGDFEQQMAELRGVTGATADELQRFEETARTLGATTTFSAKEAASGLTFLARAGFSVEDSVSALPSTLNLARSAMIGLGDAADYTSNIMSAFNLDAEQTERVVDTLAKTANSSNTNIVQLAEAMKFTAPVAGALGRSVEETSAAIGVLGDRGIQGALAGTNLRAVMLRLLRPTKQAKDALASMGLTLEDVNPNSKELSEIFMNLRDANLDVEKAAAIFNTRMAGSAIILAENADKVEELTKKNEDANGTAREMARIMGDTLQGKLKGLNSAWEELLLQTGDSGLTGVLKELVEGFTDLLQVIGDVDDDTKKMNESIGEATDFGNLLVRTWLSLVVGQKAFLKGAKEMVASRYEEINSIIQLGMIAKDVANNMGDVFSAAWDVITATGDLAIKSLIGGLKTFVSDSLAVVSDFYSGIGGIAENIPGLGGLAGKFKEAGEAFKASSDLIGLGAETGITEAGIAVANATTQLEHFVATVAKGGEVEDTIFKEMADALRAEAKLAGVELDEAEKRLELFLLRLSDPLPRTPRSQAGGGEEDPKVKAEKDINEEIKKLLTEEETNRIAALQQRFMSESELLEAQYKERKTFLEGIQAEAIEGERTKNELLKALKLEYEDEVTKLEKEQAKERARAFSMEMQTKLGIAQNGLAALQQLLIASGNQQLADSKGFGIAQAVISTAIGIAKAQELMPNIPAVVAASALVATTGAAQIAAISSASKGSATAPRAGVSAASVPSSQASNAPAPVQQTTAININLSDIAEDQVFSGNSVRNIVTRVADEINDGFEGNVVANTPALNKGILG